MGGGGTPQAPGAWRCPRSQDASHADLWPGAPPPEFQMAARRAARRLVAHIADTDPWNMACLPRGMSVAPACRHGCAKGGAAHAPARPRAAPRAVRFTKRAVAQLGGPRNVGDARHAMALAKKLVRRGRSVQACAGRSRGGPCQRSGVPASTRAQPGGRPAPPPPPRGMRRPACQSSPGAACATPRASAAAGAPWRGAGPARTAAPPPAQPAGIRALALRRRRHGMAPARPRIAGQGRAGGGGGANWRPGAPPRAQKPQILNYLYKYMARRTGPVDRQREAASRRRAGGRGCDPSPSGSRGRRGPGGRPVRGGRDGLAGGRAEQRGHRV